MLWWRLRHSSVSHDRFMQSCELLTRHVLVYALGQAAVVVVRYRKAMVKLVLR